MPQRTTVVTVLIIIIVHARRLNSTLSGDRHDLHRGTITPDRRSKAQQRGGGGVIDMAFCRNYLVCYDRAFLVCLVLYIQLTRDREDAAKGRAVKTGARGVVHNVF